MARSDVLTKEVLVEYYEHQKLPSYKIAKLVGFNNETIRRKLRKFGIPIRDRSEAKRGKETRLILTRDFLQLHYIDQEETQIEIAKLAQCDATVVSMYLKKFNFKIRSNQIFNFG